jgi:hypothetical protein
VQRVEQRVVEPGEAGSRLAHPRQVDRVRAWIAQHPHARDQLEQGRDGEAGAEQVVAAEAVGDHEDSVPPELFHSTRRCIQPGRTACPLPPPAPRSSALSAAPARPRRSSRR